MGAVRSGGVMDDSNSILQGVHASFESCYLLLQVLSRSECEAGSKNKDYTFGIKPRSASPTDCPLLAEVCLEEGDKIDEVEV